MTGHCPVLAGRRALSLDDHTDAVQFGAHCMVGTEAATST